jgi:hypothetical protein
LSLVGRDLRVLDPVAAGVFVEVDTGIRGLVDVVEAETGSRLGGTRLGKAADSDEKQ